MKPDATLKKLSRFIATMLGRFPDEFGLVPDDHGFVPVKELLKAISEEKGWRHVRRAHLNEVLLSLPKPDFEITGQKIRATDRSCLPKITRPVDLPKLLYTCVRRRAYPHVTEKGLWAGSGGRIVLSSDKTMAQRIGRRKDQHPITITVQVNDSLGRGVVYDRSGANLYLADFIPPGCLSGPPLPKEKKTASQEKTESGRSAPSESGTFRLDPSRIESPGSRDPKEKKKPGGKGPGWKRQRRQQRKHRRKW